MEVNIFHRVGRDDGMVPKSQFTRGIKSHRASPEQQQATVSHRASPEQQQATVSHRASPEQQQAT
ncbi:hypothetical protein ACJMK2_006021, partial [Sinanodonta woodiana]